MNLNVRQERFCLEYAKEANATKAYKNAGYNCKNDASATEGHNSAETRRVNARNAF